LVLMALYVGCSTFLSMASNLPWSLRYGTSFLRKYGLRIAYSNMTLYAEYLLFYALMAASALPVLLICRRTFFKHQVRTIQVCRLLLMAFSTLVVIRLVYTTVWAAMSANNYYPGYLYAYLDHVADMLTMVCFYRAVAWGFKSFLKIPRSRILTALTLF